MEELILEIIKKGGLVTIIPYESDIFIEVRVEHRSDGAIYTTHHAWSPSTAENMVRDLRFLSDSISK